MKNAFFSLCLLTATLTAGLLFASVNPCMCAETRGISIVARDPVSGQPAGEVKLYNRSFAVIIGIDKYPNLPPDRQLSYAVRDAKGVEEVLRRQFKFDRIVTLYNEQATQKGIVRLLTSELPREMGSDDSLFVFWAGHGNQEISPDGEIGYLIPYDGVIDDISTAVTMSELRDTISKKIPAKHVFYAMDACYSGLLATRSVDTKSRRDLGYMREITRERVRQVLTAGGKGQEVLDGGPRGHSVFTGRLIEVLEATGDFITANEIQAILKERVYKDAIGRGLTQTPSFGVLSGNGDFVFVPSREYQLAEKQAELDRLRSQADRTRQENEKLKKQMADDEAMLAAAQKAGDESKRQAAELELRRKQGLLKLEEARQKEREDQLRLAEREAAELKQREADRLRIQEEAQRQQARLQEAETRRTREQDQQEKEYQRQKAEEERRNEELRRLAEEKRKKALEAASAVLSIEAAVEQIKKADVEIAGINRDFDAELARQKGGADRRLAEKKARLKLDHDQRVLELGRRPAITVAKPVIAPRDMEFETQAEYRARVQKAEHDYNRLLDEARSVGVNARQAEDNLYSKGVERAEAEHGSESAAIEQRINAGREEAVRPFRERIAAIASKEYPVSPQSLKLTVGMYDPEKGSFPVRITSVSPKQDLSVEGVLPLPRDRARLFKQQYLNGLVRPDVYMKTGQKEPVRVAMVNDGVKSDANDHLLALWHGEFVEIAEIAERKRRVKIAVGEMSNVPGGCFKKAGKLICLDAFRIGRYEVTQGQWQQIMGNNPSRFKTCGNNCPVECVSWNDVQEFIGKLNNLTGGNYRLPTEPEWYYACTGGGKDEKYCGGDDVDDVAWYDNNSNDKPHPVGGKKPNGLGIYDMSGNVWEWLRDGHGSGRVISGGSWFSLNYFAESSFIRLTRPPNEKRFDLGFRLLSP
jgi:hypothetical protein